MGKERKGQKNKSLTFTACLNGCGWPQCPGTPSLGQVGEGRFVPPPPQLESHPPAEASGSELLCCLPVMGLCDFRPAT